MFQTVIAAVLAAVLKVVLGRWQPKEKPDATITAEKAEAKALAAPPASESDLDKRLRRLQQPDQSE